MEDEEKEVELTLYDIRYHALSLAIKAQGPLNMMGPTEVGNTLAVAIEFEKYLKESLEPTDGTASNSQPD